MASNRICFSEYFLITGVLALLLSGTCLSSVFAARESRPFWTEKSAFIEGEVLFVVGIASKARTPEEGRRRAFEHGKIELMDFAQLTDVEERGMFIETQMTYEEVNSDGTFTIFRLLRVPLDRLMALQERPKSKPHQKGIESPNNAQAAAATDPPLATFTREEILALQYELRRWEQLEVKLVVLARDSRQALRDYFKVEPPFGLDQLIRFLNAPPGPGTQVAPIHAPRYRCRVTESRSAYLFVSCSVVTELTGRQLTRVEDFRKQICLEGGGNRLTKTEVLSLLGEPIYPQYDYFRRENILAYDQNTWIRFDANDLIVGIEGCKVSGNLRKE